MLYRISILAICFMCSFLLGCDSIMNLISPKKNIVSVTGTVVAKVANIPVTLEALNREIDVYNAAVNVAIDANPDLTFQQKKEQKEKNEIKAPEQKLRYLNELVVRRMVFAQAGIDKGLERREDVKDVLEINRANILAQEMQNEVIKNIDVSQMELEDAYKKVKEQLKQPETRNVREIAAKTEAEAKQILLELLQGADFMVIARDRSVAESSKNSGDLGYLKKGEKGGVFDDVAFSPALQQGSISSVFKNNDGNYCIVKIEGIKEGKQLSFTEVQNKLKERLLNLKRQEELEKFYSQISRDNIRIEIHESQIK
jgi:hypothetical protein